MMEAILRHSSIDKEIDLKKEKNEITVTSDTPIKKLFHLSNKSSQSVFPVLLEDNLIGIILSRDIRQILSEKKLHPLSLIAEDIMHSPIFVDIKDSLETAVNKINKYDMDAIPVIYNNKYLKLLSFNKITKIYDHHLESRL